MPRALLPFASSAATTRAEGVAALVAVLSLFAAISLLLAAGDSGPTLLTSGAASTLSASIVAGIAAFVVTELVFFRPVRVLAVDIRNVLQWPSLSQLVTGETLW